jgi:amidohydrolase
MRSRLLFLTSLVTLLIASSGYSQQNQAALIEKKAAAILPKLIEWRRYIHQHPELSNREFKTA